MIHCVNIHGYDDRLRRAQVSWNHLEMKPFHFDVWNGRNGRDIGDDRNVPFLRDVINEAWLAYPHEDTLMYTNADSVLALDAFTILQGDNDCRPIVYSHRGNWYKPIRRPLDSDTIERLAVTENLTPENIVWRPHAVTQVITPVFKGIDLVVFKRDWWVAQDEKGLVPDLLIGYQGWDYWIRALAVQGTASDCQRLLVAHEMHGEPYWKRFPDSVGNIWNWKQLWGWAVDMGYRGRSDGCVGGEDWRVLEAKDIVA